MTSWPRRNAARISEPRLYQASSSRQTGPRALTARSRPLAMAILPALPELRHRPVTSGTERGRSRHGTTADSVTKHWHSRNAGRLVLAAWSKRTATPGRTPGCQRVVDHDKAPPPSNLPPDDPAQCRDQAEQPEPFEHPVVGLPAEPWRQGQHCLGDMPARRQHGADDQFQKREPRRLRAGLHDLPDPSAKGRRESWGGSMASAGVWFYTR